MRMYAVGDEAFTIGLERMAGSRYQEHFFCEVRQFLVFEDGRAQLGDAQSANWKKSQRYGLETWKPGTYKFTQSIFPLDRVGYHSAVLVLDQDPRPSLILRLCMPVLSAV